MNIYLKNAVIRYAIDSLSITNGYTLSTGNYADGLMYTGIHYSDMHVNVQVDDGNDVLASMYNNDLSMITQTFACDAANKLTLAERIDTWVKATCG